MAKKNGKHADVAAADSPEPVAAEAVEAEKPLVVLNQFGLVIVGPVELEGVGRIESFPHNRAHAVTLHGRECHYVRDNGDARVYRAFN